MITIHDLETLVGHALFLRERLPISNSLLDRGFTTLSETAQNRLKQWEYKAGGNGGERAFQARLSIEGIEQHHLPQLLATSTEPIPSHSLPQWALLLSAIFTAATKEIKREFSVSDQENYLVKVLSPFRVFAEQSMRQEWECSGKQTILLSAVAKEQLLESLQKRLERLARKAWQAELNKKIAFRYPLCIILGTPPSRDELIECGKELFSEFLSGGWNGFLLTYPVLARLLSETTAAWLENTSEWWRHVQEDLPRLEQTFGKGHQLSCIDSVKTDLSDRHNGGKTVSIITFQSGCQLVYKPHSGRIDQAWSAWISWLGQSGMANFYVPTVLDCGDHSWVEYVSPMPVTSRSEAESFYERAGMLLCLTYILGGGDFHMENIIAHGACPVLIDLETLLLARFKPLEQTNAGQTAHQEMFDSVLRTGLLPVWLTDSQGHAADISGFTGEMVGGVHIPSLSDEPLNPIEFRDQILQGFRRAYYFLIDCREQLLGVDSPLRHFEGILLRSLIRNTKVYGDLLERVLHPNYLRNGLDYSIELERSVTAYFLHEAGDSLPWLWKCFCSERTALERGDVPIFYNDSNSLSLKNRHEVLHPDFFSETAIQRCRAIIKRLSEADLHEQSQYIQIALSMKKHALHAHSDVVALMATESRMPACVAPSHKNESAPPAGERENFQRSLIAEAKSIYQQIMDWRIEPPKGSLTWITLQLEAASHRMNLGPINNSFYDGILGLGVFFSALFRVTGEEEQKQQSCKVVESFRQSLHNSLNPFPVHRMTLGLGTGVAGTLRALLTMGYYLKDDSFRQDAWTVIERIKPEQIDNDRQWDVFGGSAGLILVLSELPSALQSERTLALADHCGQLLLAKRIVSKSGQRVWDNGLGFAPLTGAAHGAAGFANALLRLYQMTGTPQYYDAAMEAVAYENEWFDKIKSNWPDFRYRHNLDESTKNQSFMGGWCSGAPGIGLSRLSGLPFAGKATENFHADIERATDFANNWPLTPGDTLCCGTSARIDFLVEASRKLAKQDLLEQAKFTAFQMIERKHSVGHYCFTGSEGGAIFNPAFFHGSAGIGYTFLRCVVPDKIQSMLL